MTPSEPMKKPTPQTEPDPPNPGDPGPEIPEPRTPEDPRDDERLPSSLPGGSIPPAV